MCHTLRVVVGLAHLDALAFEDADFLLVKVETWVIRHGGLEGSTPAHVSHGETELAASLPSN